MVKLWQILVLADWFVCNKRWKLIVFRALVHQIYPKDFHNIIPI